MAAFMKAKETLKSFADITRNTSDHPENCQYRKRIDEKAIQDLDMTIDEWGCDPWDLSNPTLRSTQSGFPAPPELVKDLNSAYRE